LHPADAFCYKCGQFIKIRAKKYSVKASVKMCVDIADPDYNFTDTAEDRKPYFPNQKDLNDLIRDLGLTKSNAELLTSI
jgi:hypothetical protein